MLEGLGNLISPQPTAGQSDPGLVQEWKNWFDKPENKAALLGFGVQALAGGNGSGGQQLAAALGNGFASAAGYDKIKRESDQQEWERNIKEAQQRENATHHAETMTRYDADRASREKEGAANRASHEKIAGIYADSRESVAGMKGDKADTLEKQEYMKAYNAVAQKLVDPIARQLAGIKSDDEVAIMAKKAGDSAVAAFRSQYGTNGGSGTSVNSQNGTAPMGGSAPAVSQISPSKSSANTTQMPPPPAAKPTLAELMQNPKWTSQVQAALNHPAARALLRNKVSDPQSVDSYGAPNQPAISADPSRLETPE